MSKKPGKKPAADTPTEGKDTPRRRRSSKPDKKKLAVEAPAPFDDDLPSSLA